MTTLRCGTSDEDSYVELVDFPSDLSGRSRDFAELCGFAFDQEEE